MSHLLRAKTPQPETVSTMGDRDHRTVPCHHGWTHDRTCMTLSMKGGDRDVDS